MNRRQKAALAAMNYNLFGIERAEPPPEETVFESFVDLPPVSVLDRLFELYNRKYFDGALPPVTIEYSDRMMAAGAYFPSRKLIRIGRKYHTLFPGELTDTLKHEMIHIRHFKHDAAFKAEAERLGASVRAKSHPSLRKPPRYVYTCPNCKRDYPRQKRLRMASCGTCTTGRKFDPRFKLKLKKT